MATLRDGMQLGPYVVERVLPKGRGGFAQVVIARLASPGLSGQRVALKIATAHGWVRNTIPMDEMARFCEMALTNEVEALRALKHPSIVRLYSIPLDPKRPTYQARALELDGQPWYFAMEYLSGGSVEEYAHAHGKMSIPLAVEIVQQVCSALEYVHLKEFANFDIKAGNILLRRPIDERYAPEVALADFGAVVKRNRAAAMDQATLLYAPPERVLVMRGEKPPESVTDTSAADVYSLGVLLYRLLAGRLPYQGRESHVSTAILKGDLTWPSQFNVELASKPGLEALIVRMLNVDPIKRPRAAEVIAELDSLVPAPRFTADRDESRGTDLLTARRWRRTTTMLAPLAAVQVAAIAYLLLMPPTAVNDCPPCTPQPPPTEVTITLTPSPSTTMTATETPSHTVTPAGGVTVIPAVGVNDPTVTMTPTVPTATPAVPPTVPPTSPPATKVPTADGPEAEMPAPAPEEPPPDWTPGE